jgi:hypothetical protein
MEQKEFYEVNRCEWFIPVKLIEIEGDKYTKTLEVEAIESGCRAFVPTIYKFQKPPEQHKPVVPKFVADWVDDSREYRFDFYEWFDWNKQPKIVQLWLNQENKRQAELNALALVTLIVNGANAVEIEQEKLYTVEIPNPNSSRDAHTVLIKNGFNKIVMVKVYTDVWVNVKFYQLTEEEIRKDFEWAWKWAKPVEED